MTEDQVNAYKMRIAQAGIAEFTVIMLEMEIQWIEEALSAYKANNMEIFLDDIEKAQTVQVELMNVLNLENAVSLDVYSVFVFINKELIYAKIKKQLLDLERCKEMLSKFHTSFQKIVETDDGGSVIAGGEKVYAGLTYGTGGLMENSIGGTEYKV